MTWSGFHRLSPAERLSKVADHAGLAPEHVAALRAASALPAATGSAFIENHVGSFPLPLGFAVGFVIDGLEVVAPMAVEESSVVAAASHGAKLAAQGGGFTTASMDPVIIGQIEVRDVADPAAASTAFEAHQAAWAARVDDLVPAMVRRGGGCRGLQLRDLGDRRMVVHIHLDTRDAMGANAVNTVCEALGPAVADALNGRLGLRILSNLATGRIVTASCRVPVDAVGGREAAEAIVEANDFARADPYRAATHNKGIMNGIDPVVVATGNDWRAVEAGAHAFAARDGAYRGLTTYRIDGDHLVGELSLPLAVGVVGGVTRIHPVADACLHVLGAPDGPRLGCILAAVGLAQNLSALKALAGAGIQEGHMRLHARNLAVQAGAEGDQVGEVAAALVASGTVSASEAARILRTFQSPSKSLKNQQEG